jgi:hypothetical protein
VLRAFNTEAAMPSILRGLTAVVLGYVAMAAVVMLGTLAAGAFFRLDPAAQLPPEYLAVNFTLSLVAAGIGGWICAAVARENAWAYAFSLAAIVVLLSTIMAAVGPTQPMWYFAALAVIGAAGVLAGAAVRIRGGGRETRLAL